MHHWSEQDNEGSRDNENKTPVREADNGNKASQNTDPGNTNPGQIDRDGNAELIFSHASDYTIVIDETVMDGTNEESAAAAEDTGNTGDETVPAKEADEEAHTWKPAITIIIGSCILLLALGAVIYVRKRNSSIEKSH